MQRTDKRKVVVHLKERNEVVNFRVLSEIISEKIINGGIKL